MSRKQPVIHDEPAMHFAPAEPPPQTFTGKLYRGEEEGSVRGWLYDHVSGFRIEFNGAKDPRRGGGYLLVGKVKPV